MPTVASKQERRRGSEHVIKGLAAVVAICTAFISGCMVPTRTPDGHTLIRGKLFVKGTSQASALSMLGEPDLITRRLHAGMISAGVVTSYYYLAQRYRIWFNAYWGFEGLAAIKEADVPELERRSRAFKLVREGTSLDQALAMLGPPDRVMVSPHNAYPLSWEPWAQYEQQRGGARPPDLHTAVWKARDLSLDFRDGVVEEAHPYYETKAPAPVPN